MAGWKENSWPGEPRAGCHPSRLCSNATSSWKPPGTPPWPGKPGFLPVVQGQGPVGLLWSCSLAAETQAGPVGCPLSPALQGLRRRVGGSLLKGRAVPVGGVPGAGGVGIGREPQGHDEPGPPPPPPPPEGTVLHSARLSPARLFRPRLQDSEAASWRPEGSDPWMSPERPPLAPHRALCSGAGLPLAKALSPGVPAPRCLVIPLLAASSRKRDCSGP